VGQGPGLTKGDTMPAAAALLGRAKFQVFFPVFPGINRVHIIGADIVTDQTINTFRFIDFNHGYILKETAVKFNLESEVRSLIRFDNRLDFDKNA
jgi:hypothetical protein